MNVSGLIHGLWESGLQEEKDFYRRNRSTSLMALKWAELQLPQAAEAGLFFREEWLGCVLACGDYTDMQQWQGECQEWSRSGWLVQELICQRSGSKEYLIALNFDLRAHTESIGFLERIFAGDMLWHAEDLMDFHHNMMGIQHKQGYVARKLLSTQLPSADLREDRHGLHLHGLNEKRTFRILRHAAHTPLNGLSIESGWVLDVALSFCKDGVTFGGRYTCMDHLAWASLNKEVFFEEVHYRPLVLAASMPLGLNHRRCRQLVQSNRVEPVFMDEKRRMS